MATFYIEQFGCRATQADAAAIERQLLDRGYDAAPEASLADVVVVNTCTVTAAADAQARAAIREIGARNPAARIVVTGCYAQRAPEDLAALPGVAWVVGNSHKPQIPDLIGQMAPAAARSEAAAGFVPIAQLVPGSSSLPHGPANILTGDILECADMLSAPVLGGEAGHTRPTLKIQDGCNSRCSFCVIPFVRGRSRSMSLQDVLENIRGLVSAGYKEIVLSGINLGTYGRDLTPRVELLDLLRQIVDATSLERLRLSSIEPLDITQELIDLFASSTRVAHHFHVPLQSGSDRILAAMHRWYRAEQYARRIECIRERLLDSAIGADVIAGFPGESDADHAATVDFIRRLPFTYLHVFSFSERPGTRAARLPETVAPAVIRRRARELRALGERKTAAFAKTQIGRRLRVLTLRPGEEDSALGSTNAISSNNLRVRISGVFPANEFLDVRVRRVEGCRLIASRNDDSVEEYFWNSAQASKITCASA
ncbi:MAG: tRNA (N(6)-L-threonylcarbamoyladenosine(37)-C(2))-methylthiotransferase MtaB [Candidatus Acidiferrales bacterium]|jgi:threonylcarbamoyladenosine tRNA methylthiotransferase MtaB